MRTTVAIGLLGVLLALAGCCCSSWFFNGVEGSGNLVTKQIEASDFRVVDVGSVFHAEIRRGDDFSVKVTTDDNVWEYVDVEQRGASLSLRLKQVSLRNATLQAVVTMPSVDEISVGGAATATVTGFRGLSAISLETDGASHITGDIEANRVTVDADGASHISLTGTAQDLDVEADGASNAELEGLTATNARVKIGGASTANVTVVGKLDYDADGASTIRYGGNPVLGRQECHGASSAAAR